jgi:hypothetical protein
MKFLLRLFHKYKQRMFRVRTPTVPKPQIYAKPQVQAKPRVFRVAKRVGWRNEDAFVWDLDTHRYAVSDGASTSFAGRAWAMALCRQFKRDPDIRAEWLEHARTDFRDTLKISEDDWSAAEAFERGSFATFLALSILDDQLRVFAVGDTVLFVLDGEQRIECFPTVSPETFASDPILLSSHRNRISFDETDESLALAASECPDGSLILIATDALAAWIVGDGGHSEMHKRARRLAAFRQSTAFRDFVEQERSEGGMRVDDTTLLIIQR